LAFIAAEAAARASAETPVVMPVKPAKLDRTRKKKAVAGARSVLHPLTNASRMTMWGNL
jgi:hypothetical protein